MQKLRRTMFIVIALFGSGCVLLGLVIINYRFSSDYAHFEKKVSIHDGMIRTLAMIGDGDRVISCGESGEVIVWQFRDAKQLVKTVLPGADIRSVDVFPDGAAAVCATEDGSLKIVDLECGIVTKEWKAINGVIRCVRCDSGGK